MKNIFFIGTIIILLINFILVGLYQDYAYANMLPFKSEIYLMFLLYIIPIIICFFLPSEENKLNIKKRKSSKEEFIHKTDVNNADIDELRALSFINTALAKRLVKKREEIGGFKSVEEICLYLKFNEEKSIKFREHICVNPRIIPLTEIKNDERSVDW